MKEAQLSREVIARLERAGWAVYSIKNSKAAGLRCGSAIGFVDVLAVRYGRLLALELKVAARKPTAAQKRWLERLDAVAGCEARVIYPRHLEDGVLDGLLR